MFRHVSSPRVGPLVVTTPICTPRINFVGLDVHNTSSDQFAGKMKILAVVQLSF